MDLFQLCLCGEDSVLMDIVYVVHVDEVFVVFRALLFTVISSVILAVILSIVFILCLLVNSSTAECELCHGHGKHVHVDCQPAQALEYELWLRHGKHVEDGCLRSVSAVSIICSL